MNENSFPDKKTKKKKAKKIIKIVLLSLAAALTVAIIVLGIHIYRILKFPASFFKPSETMEVTDGESTAMEPAFTLETDDVPGDGTETEAEETKEPEAETEAEPGLKSDEGKPYEIFNVMLMGIDADEDGNTSSGSMPHTDVTIVLAISFENNTMDIISLQRDTFTTAPGFRGYYKLNGVFNVGGGMKDKSGGFELVCRAAEQWLGGITIPYYYAVDFKAVVDIVDYMGGIDYDVDQEFYSYKTNKKYEKGMQHLDGNAVLGYLRVRKYADGLDKSRNTRQRNMLIAIFNKLKRENKLSLIPTLLSTAKNHVYTNTSLSQTAALANFAVNLDSANIRSRAVTGTIKMRYDWAWAFVDQAERVQLIKEVYNINVKPVGICTVQYEQWLHETGLDALKHIRQAEKVLSYVKELKDSGYEFSDTQIKQYSDCYKAYEKLYGLFNSATKELGEAYTGQSEPENGISGLESDYAERINRAESSVREFTEVLKKSVGYSGSLTYTVNKDNWWSDADINEIYVDFR